MGKKSAPKPPGPKEVATAQTAENVSTAIANAYLGNVNQVTPYGTLTYDQTGTYQFNDPTAPPDQPVVYDVPIFTATQTLSPEEQALYDINSATEQNIALIGRDQSARIYDLLATPIDAGDLPARPDLPGAYQYTDHAAGPNLDTRYATGGDITRTYGTDFSEDRLRVEQALMERLQPYLEQENEAVRSQLANQGLMMGSEGYTVGIDDYNRMANDARLGVISQAGDEQSRLVAMEAARAAFENDAQMQAYGQDRTNIDAQNAAFQQMYLNEMQRTAANNSLQNQRFAQEAQIYGMADQARNQTLNEQFALRNQPINEITALLSGSQVQTPNFINTPQYTIPTTDYAGISAQNYAQEMQQWQAQQQLASQLMGGLFGLGAGALSGGYF